MMPCATHHNIQYTSSIKSQFLFTKGLLYAFHTNTVSSFKKRVLPGVCAIWTSIIIGSAQDSVYVCVPTGQTHPPSSYIISVSARLAGDWRTSNNNRWKRSQSKMARSKLVQRPPKPTPRKHATTRSKSAEPEKSSTKPEKSAIKPEKPSKPAIKPLVITFKPAKQVGLQIIFGTKRI